MLDGKTDIAMGNVVAATSSMCVHLGISALIAPLIVNIQLIRQEVRSCWAQACCCWRSRWTETLVAEGGLLFALLVA